MAGRRKVPKKWEKRRKFLLANQGKCSEEVCRFEAEHHLPPLRGTREQVPEARQCRYQFLSQEKKMGPHIDHRHNKRFTTWIETLTDKQTAGEWITFKALKMCDLWRDHILALTSEANKPKPPPPPIKEVVQPKNWREVISRGYVVPSWADRS